MAKGSSEGSSESDAWSASEDAIEGREKVVDPELRALVLVILDAGLSFDLLAVVDLGFVVFLAVVEGRGGLNGFGGILAA